MQHTSFHSDLPNQKKELYISWVCFQYVEALSFNERPTSAEENKPLQHQFSCPVESQSVLAGWPGRTTSLCFLPPAASCSDAVPPPTSSSARPESVSHRHTGRGGDCCSQPDWLIWGQTRKSTSHFLRERFDLRNIRQQLVGLCSNSTWVLLTFVVCCVCVLETEVVTGFLNVRLH